MDSVVESSEHSTGEEEHHFVTIQVTSEQESGLEAFFQINSWQLIKDIQSFLTNQHHKEDIFNGFNEFIGELDIAIKKTVMASSYSNAFAINYIQEAKSDPGEENEAHSLVIAVTDEQESAIEAFFQINNWTLLKGVISDVVDGENITDELGVGSQQGHSHALQLHHSETMVEEVAGLQEMKVTTTGENGQPQIITLYAEARNSKGLPQSLLNEINGVGDGNGNEAMIIQEITLPDGISLDQGLVIASSHNLIRKVTPRGTVKPGDRVHKCHVCGKTFKQAQSFNGHYQTHFGAKPYQCAICNTGFTLKAALVAHQSIHTGAKPFVCTMCNKGFRRKDDMVSHLRTHTGEKPYECEICGKKFKYRNQIPKHHRAHTGDKPYACSVCQKRFTSNIHLRRHERTHTGERPYKCDTCEKAFTQYGHLQAHSRIHTDERPYACEICGRRFREKKVMKRHELLHTTERKFKCEECGRGFLRQSNLDLHSVMHQKGSKEGLKRPRPRSKKKQADIQMREFVTNVLSSVRKVDSGMQTDNFVHGITIHDETGNATDNLSAFVNFAVEQENNTMTKVEQILDDSDLQNLTENGHYTLVMQEDGSGGYLISNYDGSAVSEEIVDTLSANQIEVTTDFDGNTASNNLEDAVKQENYDDANTADSVTSAVEKILHPEKFDSIGGPVSVPMSHGSVNVIYVQALSDVHQVKENALKTEPQSVMDTSSTK